MERRNWDMIGMDWMDGWMNGWMGGLVDAWMS